MRERLGALVSSLLAQPVSATMLGYTNIEFQANGFIRKHICCVAEYCCMVNGQFILFTYNAATSTAARVALHVAVAVKLIVLGMYFLES